MSEVSMEMFDVPTHFSGTLISSGRQQGGLLQANDNTRKFSEEQMFIDLSGHMTVRRRECRRSDIIKAET